MISIDVRASRSYQVHIGQGLLPGLGQRARELCPRAERFVLVTDDSVAPLWGNKALESLRAAGLAGEAYILPHGEASKTAESLITLLDSMTGQRLTRSDCIVALGGGMTGDLTGLAAAVYMRGIDYIQVPTTLLAAVDSSVGGKTAVDLPAGKNLMGAFWQPACVLCDTDTLATLPEDIFTDGCAEVIKYAVLFDEGLFSLLEREGKNFPRQEVIAQCVRFKRDVVGEDERDSGGRRGLLNLGHTLAHAIEACSDFSVSHGKAVAIGTAVVCRAAGKTDLCAPEVPERVCALLQQFGLPTETDIPLARLMEPMLSDKKHTGSHINLVVPEKIGLCSMRSMDDTALYHFMEAGM
ncbi:MAG: 3-dehydroquinate synthase [Oscillospiraceae bacterium]|nr:3-dehydroquinate synthase [Oscillospiraceae bacterium]